MVVFPMIPNFLINHGIQDHCKKYSIRKTPKYMLALSKLNNIRSKYEVDRVSTNDLE